MSNRVKNRTENLRKKKKEWRENILWGWSVTRCLGQHIFCWLAVPISRDPIVSVSAGPGEGSCGVMILPSKRSSGEEEMGLKQQAIFIDSAAQTGLEKYAKMRSRKKLLEECKRRFYPPLELGSVWHRTYGREEDKQHGGVEYRVGYSKGDVRR